MSDPIAPELKQRIETLAGKWLALKAEEKAIKDQVAQLKKDFIDLLGIKDEGAETHTVGGYKITLEGVLNYSVDQDAWLSMADQIPPELQPIRYKPEVDKKALRHLKAEHMALYVTCAKALTIREGAPSVTVSKQKEKAANG